MTGPKNKGKKAPKAPVNKAEKSKVKVPATKSKAKAPTIATQPPKSKPTTNKSETPVAAQNPEAQSEEVPEDMEPVTAEPESLPNQMGVLNEAISHLPDITPAEKLSKSQIEKKQKELEKALKSEGSKKEAALQAKVDELTAKLQQLQTAVPQVPDAKELETPKVKSSAVGSSSPSKQYMTAEHQAAVSIAVGKPSQSVPAVESSPAARKNDLPPNDLNDDFSEAVDRQKKVFDVEPEDKDEGWEAMDKEHLLEDDDEEASGETGAGQSGVEETGPRKKGWSLWPW